MKKFEYICPFCNTKNEISVEHDDELQIVVCSPNDGVGCERVFVAYNSYSGMEYYCLINFEKVKKCRHDIKNKLTQIALATGYIEQTCKAKKIINLNVQELKQLIESIDCDEEETDGN